MSIDNNSPWAGAVNVGGAPTTMGQYGAWLDKDGNVADTDPSGKQQITPGMRDTPSAAIHYDPGTDLYFNTDNGKNLYQSPYGQTGSQGTGHGMTAPTGGFFTTRGTWNPETHTFDSGINWGNLLALGAGAGIGAGALSAAGAFGGGAGGFGAGAEASALSPELGMSSALPGAGSTMSGLLGASGTAGAADMAPELGFSGQSLAGDVAPAVAGSPSEAGTGSFISKLLGNQLRPGEAGANIARMLGNMGQGFMNERGMEGNLSQGYDRNAIAAQSAAIPARSAALRNLATSNYLLNAPNNGVYKPPTLSLGGQSYQLPTYGPQMPGISAAQKQGAQDLQTSANKTLAPGGTYTPLPPDYTTPGIGEKIGQYGGIAAGGLGLISSMMNHGSDQNAGGTIARLLGLF